MKKAIEVEDDAVTQIEIEVAMHSGKTYAWLFFLLAQKGLLGKWISIFGQKRLCAPINKSVTKSKKASTYADR